MNTRWILSVFLLAVASATLPAAEPERGIAEFPKLDAAADWPWWRGPSRNGMAVKNAAPPTKWSATENILWKTPVPGRGHSSPIIVGNRICLATADTTVKSHSVLCFDKATGKPLWDVELSRGGFPEKNHPKNTEATSTLACDGEKLYATFFHHKTVEAIALDLNGKEVWRVTAGPFNPKRYEYGYAPSPLIYKDTVIVAGEYDGDSFIVALKRADGDEAWRIARPKNISFSSPVVAHVGGKDQLLISGAGQVASYDPATGKPLWSVEGTTAATCGTAIWDGDTVFASGGYPDSETLAVKADGSEVLWRNRQKCYEQSMIVVEGYVYAFTDQGVMFCWSAADGEQKWSQRLRGPVSASPVYAGGQIYWANEAGTMYVFRPNPERFELVAENQLGEEGFASPAVSGQHLFLRTATSSGGKRQEYLYSIGEK